MQLCRICNKQSDHETLYAREMVHGTRELFQYSLCAACGTLALVDPPEDFTPYYQNYYSTASLRHDPFNSPSWLSQLFLNSVRRWALRYSILSSSSLARYLYHRKSVGSLSWGPVFDELRQSGFPVSLHTRFLDVGSGSGRALHYLSSAGFTNLTGCDPFIDEETALSLQGKIYKASIQEMQGAFDVIMFHHSFEHVPDPASDLRAAANLLAPGGVILIRIPNIASVEFLKHKGNWWGIHAPRHFFLPSQSAMQILAEEVGLEIQHIYCDSTYDHYLYSTEYALDIHDKHPLSFRADSAGIWTAIELENAHQKAELLNRKLCGDWIGYILRRPSSKK